MKTHNFTLVILLKSTIKYGFIVVIYKMKTSINLEKQRGQVVRGDLF